jgi:hypothetical protein
MKTKKFLIAAGLAATAFAAPAMAQLSVNIGIGAPMAPPAPVYEAAPPPPAVGYVWVPGYWGWNYDRYVWVRGRYVVGRPGYAWVPDRWDHRGERWHHEQGHWAREGRGEGRGHGEHGRGHGRG